MNRPRLTGTVVRGLTEVWSLARADADMMDTTDEREHLAAVEAGLTDIWKLTAWYHERHPLDLP